MNNQKVETVNYLVKEIDDELAMIKYYQDAVRETTEKTKATGKQQWQCMNWEGRKPNKARIVDRCKIARQILMEISKEVEQL